MTMAMAHRHTMQFNVDVVVGVVVDDVDGLLLVALLVAVWVCVVGLEPRHTANQSTIWVVWPIE